MLIVELILLLPRLEPFFNIGLRIRPLREGPGYWDCPMLRLSCLPDSSRRGSPKESSCEWGTGGTGEGRHLGVSRHLRLGLVLYLYLVITTSPGEQLL